MNTQRILLLADITSNDAQRSAALLDICGYSAVTLFDLYTPDYRHNQKMNASDRMVQKWITLEMMEGARIVLHDEHAHILDVVRKVAWLCEWFGTPMVLLEDLESQASHMTDERYDAVNIANMYRSPVPVISMAQDHVVDPTFSDGLLDDAMPTTAPHTMRVVRDTVEPRLSRWDRFDKWMTRFFSGMKNPMVREQQEQHARTYKLDTAPLSTTG